MYNPLKNPEYLGLALISGIFTTLFGWPALMLIFAAITDDYSRYGVGLLIGVFSAGFFGAYIWDYFSWKRDREWKVKSDKRIIEEAKKSEAQRFKENQQAIYQQLVVFTKDSSLILKNLPNEVRAAVKALDQAETEFTEGAFAPFWGAIERAANCLARFESGIQQIRSTADSYRNQQGELQATPPLFELDFSRLPDIVPVVARMQQIVRPAQKNIDFAQIYEARKTNKMLVQGFSSLGHALNEMSSRIESSMYDLSYSISELNEYNQKNSSKLIANVESLSRQIESDAAAKDKKLDNINSKLNI